MATPSGTEYFWETNFTGQQLLDAYLGRKKIVILPPEPHQIPKDEVFVSDEDAISYGGELPFMDRIVYAMSRGVDITEFLVRENGNDVIATLSSTDGESGAFAYAPTPTDKVVCYSSDDNSKMDSFTESYTTYKVKTNA